MHVVLSLAAFAIFVISLIDVIRKDDSEIRYLPKFGWIIVIILLPFIGSMLWWGLGREYTASPPRLRSPFATPSSRTSTAAPSAPAARPDARTTEEQIADLDREIEEWRLREELAKRRGDGDPDSAASQR